MPTTTKVEIELPSEAADRFAEAVQLMGKAGVPDVPPEVLIAFLVALANPVLAVRRTLARYDPTSLSIEEEYDLEVSFFDR